MAYEYYCQAYWPKVNSARTAPTDTKVIGAWLTEMSAAGWDHTETVQVGDDVRPTEVLYFFRRPKGPGS